MGHGEELMLSGTQLARAAKRWRVEAKALPEGDPEQARLLGLAKMTGDISRSWADQDQFIYEASPPERVDRPRYRFRRR